MVFVWCAVPREYSDLDHQAMHLVPEGGPYDESTWLCNGVGAVFERTPWDHKRLCALCRLHLMRLAEPPRTMVAVLDDDFDSCSASERAHAVRSRLKGQNGE